MKTDDSATRVSSRFGMPHLGHIVFLFVFNVLLVTHVFTAHTYVTNIHLLYAAVIAADAVGIVAISTILMRRTSRGSEYFFLSVYLIILSVILTAGVHLPFEQEIFVLGLVVIASNWWDKAGILMTMIVMVSAILLGIARAGELAKLQNVAYTSFLLSCGLAVVLYFLGRRTSKEKDMIEVTTKLLDLEHNRLQSLLEGSAEAVFILDTNGLVLEHNATATTFASDGHPLIQRNIFDILPLSDQSGRILSVKSITNDRLNVLERNDMSFIDRSGTRVKLLMRSIPVRADINERPRGYIIMLRDVTNEKSLDEQRNEFVSVVSHELRTPVAIVEGSISSVMTNKKEPLTPLQHKMIDNAHQNVLFLSQLINDLNTLTQAENKEIDTTWKGVAPLEVLKKLFEFYVPLATQKGISLALRENITDKQIITSPAHLQEILHNYISNAIKYTPPNGQILVGAEFASGGVTFSVADNGPGLSPSDQKKMFTKFYRKEDYHNKTTKGAGLGLYISRQLADRIGARVWCTSELGKGSVFYIYIPAVAQHIEDRKQVISAEVSEVVEGI